MQSSYNIICFLFETKDEYVIKMTKTSFQYLSISYTNCRGSESFWAEERLDW